MSGLGQDLPPLQASITSRHPIYAARYQRTKARLGRHRGPSIGRVDIARRLTEAIWHMRTTNKPFAAAGATTTALAA